MRTGPISEQGLVRTRADMEARLVERARGGEAAAFDALVEMRLTPTFRLARAILNHTADAEDATQEAFTAAWRRLGTLRDPYRFDAWFSRIVVNACRMRMRRRPAVDVVSLDVLNGERERSAPDASLDALVELDALNRAIDTLPFEQRALLALYYLEDRPVASVAAILAIPAGTVKWRLHQARNALRDAMGRGNGRVGRPARAADKRPVVLPRAADLAG